MIRTERHETIVTYQSEVCDQARTNSEALAPLIAWADANPIVYRIVTETRSKAFGRGASLYLACDHGMDSSSILGRLKTFKRELDRVLSRDELNRVSGRDDSLNFHQWLATFTFEHYDDPGFRSGYMQQWDGTYDRGCAYVDYIPSALPMIINRFRAWCGSTFETRAVRLDGEDVWNGCDHDKSRKRLPTGELVCNDCGREITA